MLAGSVGRLPAPTSAPFSTCRSFVLLLHCPQATPFRPCQVNHRLQLALQGPPRPAARCAAPHTSDCASTPAAAAAAAALTRLLLRLRAGGQAVLLYIGIYLLGAEPLKGVRLASATGHLLAELLDFLPWRSGRGTMPWCRPRESHMPKKERKERAARSPLATCSQRGRHRPTAPGCSSPPAPCAPPPAASPRAPACAPPPPVGWEQQGRSAMG